MNWGIVSGDMVILLVDKEQLVDQPPPVVAKGVSETLTEASSKLSGITL